LLSTIISYSQVSTKKVGDIEVRIIEQNYLHNSHFKITKRKTNKSKRPKEILYFNDSGDLLKKLYFGKHHNPSLKMLDRIELFFYHNEILNESIEYENGYDNIIRPEWKSKYSYNKLNQLITESTYYYDTDSLFFKTQYEYDNNLNETKSKFDNTSYVSNYDSLNRKISLNQLSQNKLRWEWNFTYSDSTRTGIFQTHYNDGKDYSKKETNIYIHDKLITSEEKYVSKDGIDKMIKLYYYSSGIIRRIEYYESYRDDEKYSLCSYKNIKVNTDFEIDQTVADKINDNIDI